MDFTLKGHQPFELNVVKVIEAVAADGNVKATFSVYDPYSETPDVRIQLGFPLDRAKELFGKLHSAVKMAEVQSRQT